MNRETFYRFLADQPLPCPHCGAPTDPVEREAFRTGVYDGRPQSRCTACGGTIPAYEWRDYGTGIPRHSPASGRHWISGVSVRFSAGWRSFCMPDRTFVDNMREAQEPATSQPVQSELRKRYTSFPAHYTDEQIQYEVDCMYRMTQNMYR